MICTIKLIVYLTCCCLDCCKLDKSQNYHIYQCSTSPTRSEVRQQPAETHHGLCNDSADCAGTMKS